jgi:hypothetical protein
MHLKPALPWLTLALAVWVAGVTCARLTRHPGAAQRPEWQHSYLELDAEGRRSYAAVREAIFEAENRRVEQQAWPAPAALAADGISPFDESPWELRQAGPSVNYLGERAGLRWLVLFIEPDRRLRSPGAPPAPVDEEHHTLSDGMALHVTVWSRPTGGAPLAAGVASFPAVDGWVQRVGQ